MLKPALFALVFVSFSIAAFWAIFDLQDEKMTTAMLIVIAGMLCGITLQLNDIYKEITKRW